MKRRTFLSWLISAPILAKLARPKMRVQVGSLVMYKSTPIHVVTRGVAAEFLLPGVAVYMRGDGKWAPCGGSEPISTTNL